MSISVFNSVCFYLMHFSQHHYLPTYIQNCDAFLVNWPFYHCVESLFIPDHFFALKLTLCDISIATSDFFWLMFARYFFSHPFIFNLPTSLIFEKIILYTAYGQITLFINTCSSFTQYIYTIQFFKIIEALRLQSNLLFIFLYFYVSLFLSSSGLFDYF